MPVQFTMGEQPSKTVSNKHLAPKVELFDITWHNRIRGTTCCTTIVAARHRSSSTQAWESSLPRT